MKAKEMEWLEMITWNTKVAAYVPVDNQCSLPMCELVPTVVIFNGEYFYWLCPKHFTNWQYVVKHKRRD